MTDCAGKWKFSDTLTEFDSNPIDFEIGEDRDNPVAYRTFTGQGKCRSKFFWHTWRRKPKIKSAKIQLPQGIKRKMKLNQKGWKK